MKNISVKNHLKEKLKDPYFKEIYEIEQQKFKIVRMIIDYRIKHNLNQKQLAQKVGVTQQYISKIENGIFSSIMSLEKVLLAIGYTMQINAKPLPPKIRKHISEALMEQE